MSLASFDITVQPGGGASVIVNDEDVSTSVASLSVQTSADARAVPIVNIQLTAGGVIRGEGIVQVNDGQTALDNVAEFLAQIDGSTLNDLVTAELQQGGGTFGELAMTVLRRMVEHG